MIIGAGFEDFLTEESSIVLDYVPTVRMSFRSTHLAEGTALAADQISVICGRFFEVGSDYASWSGQGTLEVVEPSRRTQIGGQSWRFRWDATRPGGGHFGPGRGHHRAVGPGAGVQL